MDENDGGKNVIKRRRKATIKSPPKLHPNGNHSASTPSSSLESSSSASNLALVSLKSPTTASYTSLKDLLPSSPASSALSPTANSAAVSSASSSTYEISIPIRNRLVKQAAYAYLQPTLSPSHSSSSTSPRGLCFSGEFLRPICAGVRKFVVDAATRVYDWLVEAVWLILCR